MLHNGRVLGGDFDRSVLEKMAHRPWPMPTGPWLMTQTWNDLLFAHWPVDKHALRERVPAGLELDLFDGEAWLGVVPFHMTNVAPRLVPALPWISAFPELNVRTYVKVGGKPGVYFFSLDAGNPAAVMTARKLLNLPYFTAKMETGVGQDGSVQYDSRRASLPSAEFTARYRGVGDAHAPVSDTLEYFLTERYCLYAIDHGNHAYRLDIHHPAWPLQPGDGHIALNTMAAAAGIRHPDVAPLFHFSKRQDVVCWAPQRIG
jgi:uncharacterized protein YqjF (DUF2071 family)